jgi:hypothetical protein
MRKNLTIYLLLTIVLFFVSCTRSILEKPETSKKEVFETFWQFIDSKYSFFHLKNIDWDAAYNEFSPSIKEEMSEEAFFDTLSSMISILEDGHSGIDAPFNSFKYAGFFTKGPENYDERLILDHYSKGFSPSVGSLKYFTLWEDKILYVGYHSFEGNITDADIDYLVNKYSSCRGMIIDIRNNFGGNSNNVTTLLKRFFLEEKAFMKSRLKNGPGHNDFTEFETISYKPGNNHFMNPVCILTNRKVYSAASIFTLAMRELPNAVIVGDTTGGGLGLPIGKELPNGWFVHCAASHLYSMDDENFELGIPPDIQVDMKKEDRDKGVDTIIETAIDYIKNQYGVIF